MATSTTDCRTDVYIYVDNSNLWHEAKKLVGKSRGTKEDYDPRVRVEIRKLADVAADGRRVAKRFFYHSGSKPRQADKVWEKIKEQGFEVHERSKVTELFDDIKKMARETQEKKRSTFVIMTGDARAVPAIEEALEHKWKVEVVMWKDAISPKLKALEGRIKLRDLDNHGITFTNRKFELSIPQLRQQLEESGVVLKVDKKEFSQWHCPPWYPKDEWYEKVEDIAQCEFQYQWANFEDSKEIFGLILCFNEEGFNLEEFMRKLNEKKVDLHIINVQKYKKNYTQSMKWETLANDRLKKVLYLDKIKARRVRTVYKRAIEEDNENGGTDAEGWQSVGRARKRFCNPQDDIAESK